MRWLGALITTTIVVVTLAFLLPAQPDHLTRNESTSRRSRLA
jgi:hypothetical protein